MTQGADVMMNPRIEDLLEAADSKFRLVTVSARRAREINAYYAGLGERLDNAVPPQVTSVASKPLSIAFEELAEGKIEPKEVDPEELLAEAQAAADAKAMLDELAAAEEAAKSDDDKS